LLIQDDLIVELPAVKYSDSKNAVASPIKTKKVKKKRKVLRGIIKEAKIKQTILKSQPRRKIEYQELEDI